MQYPIINETFQEYRFKLDEFLKGLHKLSVDIGSSEFQNIVSDLRSNINEPFLFVVVVEVEQIGSQ